MSKLLTSENIETNHWAKIRDLNVKYNDIDKSQKCLIK